MTKVVMSGLANLPILKVFKRNLECLSRNLFLYTPVDTSTKLLKATDEDQCVDQQLYQSAIDSLLYLSVGTRPDITYSVSTMARFSAKPTK